MTQRPVVLGTPRTIGEGTIMADRLFGKVCIVTGAARESVLHRASDGVGGADVAIVDLTRIDQAKDVEEDIKGLGRRSSRRRPT